MCAIQGLKLTVSVQVVSIFSQAQKYQATSSSPEAKAKYLQLKVEGISLCARYRA